MVMIGVEKTVESKSACQAIMDAEMRRANIEMIALYPHHPAVETDETSLHRAHLQDRAADVTTLPPRLVHQGKCFSQLLAHGPRAIRPKTRIMED
jgi:hypothetical protein